MKIFIKQANDHLDYDIDLSDWLTEGDVIQSVEAEAPDGIELTQVGYEATRAKLWIKGGSDGQSYKFSPLIYTNSRVKEVDLLIVVQEL